MTDPNVPPRTEPRPDDRPNVHTTVNTPSSRGGGTAIAFIVGGLLVLVAVIAFFVLTGRAPAPEVPTADVEVDIQAPELPSVPTPDMPESPAPAAPPSTGAAG